MAHLFLTGTFQGIQSTSTIHQLIYTLNNSESMLGLNCPKYLFEKISDIEIDSLFKKTRSTAVFLRGFCNKLMDWSINSLASGFQTCFIFTPKLREMIQFDEHIFQMGWSKHLPITNFLDFTPWTINMAHLNMTQLKRKVIWTKSSVFRLKMWMFQVYPLEV